jgi:hypothetical protein
MSLKRSFARMQHRCDIESKQYVVNDTGQRKAEWVAVKLDERCGATPAGSKVTQRVTPTSENMEWLTVMFPYDSPISYESRIPNIRSQYGGAEEIAFDGPFQVHQIDRTVSFTGRVQYLLVTLKSVIEQ